jgi:CBS domain containing-hemolysin-like protein
VANVISWIVLIIVPIGGIVLFWLVHIMPEKIAEKNHHPQQKAIKTLCLLSLAFGGLLWPIAWLWAYTKPVGYRMAYGTDKHEEYYVHMAERAERGELDQEQLDHLRAEFFSMAERGALDEPLRNARERVARATAAKTAAAPPPSRTGGAA